MQEGEFGGSSWDLLIGETQNQVPVPKEKNYRWKDGIYERDDQIISLKKHKTCLQGF